MIISSVLIFFLPVLSNSTVINYNYDFASNTFTKVSATYGSVQAPSGYIDVLDGNNLYIAGKGWVDLAAAGVEGKLVDWDYYSNRNQGYFITETPAPVPEPATMILFGTGIAGLIAARRRKKAC